jgi:hypothetical protein
MTHAIPWTSRNGIRKDIPASTTRKTHPRGASTSAKPLETTLTKVIHAMLPIDPGAGERAGFGKSDRDGKKNRIRVFVAPWIFAQLAGSSATSMTPRLLWMVFANPAF